MRKLWFVLFLLGCSTLIAQNEAGGEEAQSLHEEGIALLQQEPVKVFDKIQALEKFIQSQNLLLSNKGSQSELYKDNDLRIDTLTAFFTQYQNSDSLLQSTRFFPDSIFQRNPAYSDPFKLLLRNYLDLKESITKTAFFKIKDLYIPDGTAQQTESIPIINFSNYWPLELVEFEGWLEDLEDRLRGYPKASRDELLFLQLQDRLSTLNSELTASNHLRAQGRLSDRIARVEEERAAAQVAYKQLKRYGLVIMCIVLLIAYLFWKRSNQVLKRDNQLLLEEKKRSEDLLTNMLPAELVGALKHKGSVKARSYEAVSVLFSDFKDFSQIAKTLSPEELVGELNYCFTAFDHIIEKYHLQKIKTIGDAYMCVGGLYTRGDKHIYRMVGAALEMQQFLLNRKAKSSEAAQHFREARIGIHTGRVVAGVIGTKKIAFDVWGDTVNVAQQMEQHCEIGKVNISGDTFDLIKDKFDCEYSGKALLKNKKGYDMYLVKRMFPTS